MVISVARCGETSRWVAKSWQDSVARNMRLAFGLSRSIEQMQSLSGATDNGVVHMAK